MEAQHCCHGSLVGQRPWPPAKAGCPWGSAAAVHALQVARVQQPCGGAHLSPGLYVWLCPCIPAEQLHTATAPGCSVALKCKAPCKPALCALLCGLASGGPLTRGAGTTSSGHLQQV